MIFCSELLQRGNGLGREGGGEWHMTMDKVDVRWRKSDESKGSHLRHRPALD
jgi:hypothetical protein